VYKIIVSYQRCVFIEKIFRYMPCLRYFSATYYPDVHNLFSLATKCALDKAVGMIFHHLADLVKVLHIVHLGHTGELPYTFI